MPGVIGYSRVSEMVDGQGAAHGATAVGAVASMLLSPDRETRWRAAVALERVGAPAVDALVTVAGHEDYLVRLPTIWALENVGNARAIEPLIQNLNGENECCRWTAAVALDRVGGEQGRAAVERAFANDPAGRGYVEELIAES